MPEVIRDPGAMARRSIELAATGRVALVPTMGCLHEGHLALVREAGRLCSHVVVSIFVNPIQFGPGEDFEGYPRDLERDCRLLAQAGAGVVFAPEAAEMFTPGHQTYVEVTELSRPLCGAGRPGHFRGVATVVLKLLNLVRPAVAVFGEKDYQQLAVIRRMVKDLNLDVEIVGHPTVRENDGLALSSRNTYLSAEERRNAPCLYRALTAAREAVLSGEREAGKLLALMRGILERTPGVRIDYVAVADAATLEALERVEGEVLLAVAARVGPARLIDNVRVAPPGDA